MTAVFAYDIYLSEYEAMPMDTHTGYLLVAWGPEF
jgi:hypothetical protein